MAEQSDTMSCFKLGALTLTIINLPPEPYQRAKRVVISGRVRRGDETR